MTDSPEVDQLADPGTVEDVDHPETEGDQADTPEEKPEEERSDEQPDEEPGSDREAARYRRRLREAEAERDALAEKIAAHQHAAVDRICADHRFQPRVLWAAGVELADLTDDDGMVVGDRVSESIKQARRDLGIPSLIVPDEGNNPRARSSRSMADALMNQQE